MTPADWKIAGRMRGLGLRAFFWIAPAALAAYAIEIALRSHLTPTNTIEALSTASALAGVFGLGATGLAILRAQISALTAPAVGAVTLSITCLSWARQGHAQLYQIGLLATCLSTGLILRAIRIRKKDQPCDPQRPDEPCS